MDEGNLANDLPDWWPYPVQCGHGHPWSPGHVIVSYVSCLCCADEGISGHTVVRCTTDGCLSAWYRPSTTHPAQRRPATVAFPLQDLPKATGRAGVQHRGEPLGGEPSSADAGRLRVYWSVRYPALTRHRATAIDASRQTGSRSHRGSELSSDPPPHAKPLPTRLATASHSHADVSLRSWRMTFFGRYVCKPGFL